MISSPNSVGLRTSTAASRMTSQLAPFVGIAVGNVADAVLDHDHRAIDDHAEVDGSQAQQAGRDAEAQHAGEGEQHRQRDGQGHDHRRPQVAQEQEQHRDDQQAALEQVACARCR